MDPIPEIQRVSKNEVKTQHVVAEIAPKTTNPDAVKLKAIKDEQGAKRMWQFRAEKEGKDDEMQIVNWKEIDTVAETEGATGTPSRHAFDQVKGQYAEIIKGEMINSATIDAALPAFAKIPGFSEIIRAAVNDPRATGENVQNFLLGDATAIDASLHDTVRGIIEQNLKNPNFGGRLRKIISTNKLPADYDSMTLKAEQVTDLERQKSEINTKIGTLQGVISTYETTYGAPATRLGVRTKAERMYAEIKNLSSAFVPTVLDKGTMADKLREINGIYGAKETDFQVLATELLTHGAFLAGGGLNPDQKTKRYNLLSTELSGFHHAKSLLESSITALSNTTEGPMLTGYLGVLGARQEISELDKSLDTINGKLMSNKDAVRKRDNELERYKQNFQHALEGTVRGYWNDAILKDAQTLADNAADAEMKKKAEDGTKDEKARSLLSGFLRKTYFTYNADHKVTGFDDKWIKEAAKSIRSTSPADETKQLLTRIYEKRDDLPPAMRDQVKKLWDSITDEATHRKIELTTDQLDTLGKEFMPDVLGYAYAKGYWSDRLKLSKAQYEFVKDNYGPEFWSSVVNKRDTYKAAAQEEFRKELMSMGQDMDVFLKSKVFTDNWATFLPRLLKVVGVGSLIALVTFGGVGLATLAAPHVTAAAGKGAAALGGAIGGMGSAIGEGARMAGDLATAAINAPNAPIITTEVIPGVDGPAGIVDRITTPLQQAQGVVSRGAEAVGQAARTVASNIPQPKP